MGIVESSIDAPSDGADLYGWDWSATTHEAIGTTETSFDVVTTMVEVLEPDVLLPGKGKQGWPLSLQAFDSDGYRTASIFYGGGRSDVHVESTSEHADFVRPRVGTLYGAKTARVDTRCDTKVPFPDLVEVARGVAGPRTKLTFMASEVGGESTGRTLYVGSPTSHARVRIYEKWLESPGQYEEGTNRVEVQLRPPSRGKREVSDWLPGETFCATKLTRRLALALGETVHRPGSLQKSRGVPDLERTLEAMGRQYGGAVGRWLEASGGDVGTVLDRLRVTGTLDN